MPIDRKKFFDGVRNQPFDKKITIGGNGGGGGGTGASGSKGNDAQGVIYITPIS